MSFKEFLVEDIEKKSIFVCLLPTEKTLQKLNSFCDENNIARTVNYDGKSLEGDHDFHLTIFFTKSNADIKSSITPIDPIVSFSKKVELLGENKNILTLAMEDSDELNAVYNFYEKVFGLKSNWNSFTPHVSLSYDKDQTLDKIPEFPLVFDKLYVSVK